MKRILTIAITALTITLLPSPVSVSECWVEPDSIVVCDGSGMHVVKILRSKIIK